MALLRPTYAYKRITDLSPEFFTEKGIKCLLLDVDNTLTTHDNPVPADGVENWLEQIKKSGLTAVILSNNSDERVKPLPKSLTFLIFRVPVNRLPSVSQKRAESIILQKKKSL